MYKRILFLIIAFLLVFAVAARADDDEISVLINGLRVIFPDRHPVIVSDRTLVPMRAVFENMGCYVEWNGDSRTVSVHRVKMENYLMITLKIDDNEVKAYERYKNANGVFADKNTTFTLDVPPTIMDDRTLLPLRAVSEFLGAGVEWLGASRTVDITYSAEGTLTVSDDEIKADYVRAKNILVNTETRAIEIISLLNNGVSFDMLVSEYNTDPGMKSSPEGYLFTHGEMMPEFEAAAFSLNIGSYTSIPVKSQLGYHIIKREPLSFEDISAVRIHKLIIMSGVWEV